MKLQNGCLVIVHQKNKFSVDESGIWSYNLKNNKDDH